MFRVRVCAFVRPTAQHTAQRPEDIYCFQYKLPSGDKSGWKVYDFEAEMKRQGIPNQVPHLQPS